MYLLATGRECYSVWPNNGTVGSSARDLSRRGSKAYGVCRDDKLPGSASTATGFGRPERQRPYATLHIRRNADVSTRSQPHRAFIAG